MGSPLHPTGKRFGSGTGTEGSNPSLSSGESDELPYCSAGSLPVRTSTGFNARSEVRAATLAALAPLPGETLWDVGAGCGSISIEWLRAGEGRSALAIERRSARAAIIARNATSLGVPRLRIVAGAAPEALDGLPAPDAIFAGGGIGEPGLLALLWTRLRPGGRLVANVVTAEGEARLLDWHATYGGELTRLAIGRAEPLGPRHLWRSLAPVTQLAITKPE